MRRIAMLMVLGSVLLAGSSFARAQTVAVSGTVSWTALTRFDAHSGEVVFVDTSTSTRVVASLTGLDDKVATYSATLNAGSFYVASAVIADCASDPQNCGTATVGGTHIRFGVTGALAPEDGSPIVVDFLADAALNPTSICGTATVDAGTFVKLFVTTSQDNPDIDFQSGVFSTAIANAPTNTYCVVAPEFAFTFLDETLTITQTQVPTCPSPLDIHGRDFLITGTDPITVNLHVTVPPAPGEIAGTFSVTGFTADATSLFASNPGPTIGACAGLTSFSTFGGPGPLSFDISPALAGQWTLFASAFNSSNTTDGLFQISRSTSAVVGTSPPQVNVSAGSPVVPSLSYTAGQISGTVSTDARRWGAPFATLGAFPNFDAATSATGAVGATWNSTFIVVLPMQVSETYDLNVDPRGTNWAVRTSSGIGYQYQFPLANGSSSAGYNGVAAIPNFGANTPTDIVGSLGVVVGNVAASAHVTVNTPPVNFRIASVKLNPLPNGPFQFWFANQGRYTLANGVLGVQNPQLFASTFDGSAAIGRAMLPPGIYEGSTTTADSDFNSFTEDRTFDLEPDDDLTADFGAPMLLQVRPKPGAAGGSATVTGKVVTTDPGVTSLQVLVNGASATVAVDGSFSASAVIGTSALTVVASDNLGRTTTLKRYFTTITGLQAPATGADLVSENQDVNAITNSVFQAPTAALSIGTSIPLKLTGALAGVPVDSTNVTQVPQLVGIVRVAFGATPTNITLPGSTAFADHGNHWHYNLSTTGLTAGTYVVQIRFWDGRVLEAALVLS